MGGVRTRPPRPLPGASLSFRRSRFGELVARQLDLFEQDEAALLDEAAELERAYDAADRDAAEEAYGDYQLVLEAVAERLEELRDAYARTLDDEVMAVYTAAFDRAARKRHPRVRLS